MTKIISYQSLYILLMSGVFNEPEHESAFSLPMEELCEAQALEIIDDYAIIYRNDIDLVEDLVEDGIQIDPVKLQELFVRPVENFLVLRMEGDRRLWYTLD